MDIQFIHPLLGAGKSFSAHINDLSVFKHQNYLLSDAETEVWNFETRNSKTIAPILPPGEVVSGIGLFAVDINYCSK